MHFTTEVVGCSLNVLVKLIFSQPDVQVRHQTQTDFSQPDVQVSHKPLTDFSQPDLQVIFLANQTNQAYRCVIKHKQTGTDLQ